MKQAKLMGKVAALVFVGGIWGTASAEVVNGVSLGAWEVVSQFNGMNNGTGLHFRIVNGDANLYRIFNADDRYEFADLGAYPDDSCVVADYFSTMRTALSLTFNTDGGGGVAQLNYNGFSTSTAYPGTNSNNATLSVGAAYIYTMYITQGQYGGPFAIPTSTANPAFTTAFTILTNQDRIRLDNQGGLGVNLWDNSNPYLQSLLSINNDKNYWLSVYDPDKLYTEIGYYSVFVMNNFRSDGSAMGNMLYLANMNPVPEPETWAMLLAGLGMVGVVARRRRDASR